jgi:hypothetical protein
MRCRWESEEDMTHVRCGIALAAMAVALTFASCSKSPTSPSSGLSGRLLGRAGFQVVAPETIAPGETAALIANIVRPDGSLGDVSGQVEWQVQSFPSGSDVLALTGPGRVTGRERGRSVITARMRGLTADATVFVLPKGTFRLTGKVTDGGIPLGNVAVTVIGGVGEGLATRTDATGEYELYGVAGVGHIRISKDGYQDRAQQIQVTAHSSLMLELTRSESAIGYAGIYTLVVSGRDCTAGFPDSARRRAYTAHVEQTGNDLWVSLSGSDLRRGSFVGAVAPTGEITFTVRPHIDWWEDWQYDIIERWSNQSELFIYGNIKARRSSAGISAKGDQDIHGVIEHYPSQAGLLNRPLASSCVMDSFEMVPR